MTRDFPFLVPVVAAMALELAACASGGAGTQNSAPPASVAVPAPYVPPPLISPVAMLEAPAPQEFSAFAIGDPLRIRYVAASGSYEVMATGQSWDALIDDPGSGPGSFLFASAPHLISGYVYALTRYDHPEPELRFRYSSLVRWEFDVAETGKTLRGTTVFGSATPSGGVPVTGTASYRGQISGVASVPAISGWGNADNAPVGGTVLLDFNFSTGSLAGQIKPRLDCDCDPITFPTLDFVDTNFSVGSQTFSGRFATGVSGSNAFSGVFTGPNAQELIGQWVFPFLSQGVPHSVAGTWIAKQSN